MVHKIRMPKIDANVEEGAIGRWLVEVGRRLRAGQPLVEIITDKAAFALEPEQGGILREQVAAEKSVVPVGYVIALLAESDSEPLPDVSDENREIMRRHLDSMLLSADGAARPGERAARSADDSERVRATPAARRLARREGVALADLEHSEGRTIQESDVIAYVRRRAGAQEGGPNAD
jgi:pyruvate/2-oxoglutarate dehydrogenase complex dihydrolipoamide acyltransferase (E2) component